MVKGMGDDLFVQVIPQVTIEARANVFVHRFQFNEHQRQTVDETNQVRATVVAGRAQSGFGTREKLTTSAREKLTTAAACR